MADPSEASKSDVDSSPEALRKNDASSNQRSPDENTDVESVQVEGDDVLDGGDVRGIEELRSFNQQRHEADTARNLAYLLVSILGGYVIIHYLSVILIVAQGWNDGDVSTLQDIFNASLPVLAGLAGSAVTYFFTKRSR